MKILITGGAGFIGSAVIRHIIANTDDSVMNLDLLTYAGNLNNLNDISKSNRYKFAQIDICEGDKLRKVFSSFNPDYVMHLAAESHVDNSIDSPAKFIETNIIGTYKLLEISREYWKELDNTKKKYFKFHHISTDEVYGDLPHPMDSPDAKKILFTESTCYKPSSPYSASKASSDHLVRAWMRTYGLPTLVTNCSNNYGPYQHPEKFIPKMIINALDESPLTIYGSGNQIRDWLYVEDHAKALYKVVTESCANKTYNIGAHNEIENIEVVKQICNVMDTFYPNKNHLDLITFVKDRPGHDMRYAIDSSKIMDELNWTPDETFKSGIKKTIQWYLDNREWVTKIKETKVGPI